MRTIVRISLLGLLLYLADFIGAFVGLIIFKLTSSNRLPTQFYAAIFISFVSCAFLCFVWKKIMSKTFLYKPIDLFWVFATILILNPLIFVALHYKTQDYLDCHGNMVLMMFFQIPMNSVILILVYSLWSIRLNVGEDELLCE